ncbi:phage holin [Sediminibacillus dalangtanensis]|uniref:Phage holin n=1 Tax=Sediminibacillus dalangtanensis TaxID=2729421 RepID=A0ABX7VY14_9BACI|nr:phage holin [Sediminibacillus dalangtanensis]QTM99222.1 phage holin [Sediminibacillus dalangtanensis]
MDKGTWVRTVVLALALVNQVLVMFSKSPLPIDNEMAEQITASIFTVVTSVYAWFKNNYVTKKGKQQRDILRQNGLSK